MKKINIGYGKLGRAWCLDINAASTVGGDADVIRLLRRLAPTVTGDVTLIGRCSKHEPSALRYPANVRNPWFGSNAWDIAPIGTINYKAPGQIERYIESFIKATRAMRIDALVLWVGQHGSVTRGVPMIGQDWGGQLALPLVQTAIYCSYLVELCNTRGIEPILLVPDPRNYLKLREFKKPFKRPFLAQWTGDRMLKHEQFNKWPKGAELSDYGPGFRDGSVWVSTAKYVYAGVELAALDEPRQITCTVDYGYDFGIIVNENKKEVTQPRLPLLRDWVLEHWPQTVVYGSWSDESQAELGRTITPVPVTQMYQTLRQFMATITFPASGSNWATAKPWECFAAGTVCFFHPRYDEQDNILMHERYNTGPKNRAELRELHAFLRISSREELWDKVAALKKDKKLHKRIVALQRQHFERGFKTWRGGVDAVITEIQERT